MATSQNPHKKEQPSTYIVQDRQNKDELARLTIQDRMITAAMGGPLPEQPAPAIFQRVLDIGCGSGSWVIEMAQQYPHMSLVGIDISQRMIDYAHKQAAIHGVADRVEFRVMDALRTLEFPNECFDLVNLRLGIGWVRTWDWLNLLHEMQRVTRPGGIVRVTDEEVIHPNNSPAFTRLFKEMLLCALYRSGHLFEEETTGLSAHLARLLKQHGCRQVQTQAFALEFRAGTPQGQAYYEDQVHAFRTLRPFMQKWGCLTDEYDALTQQALVDMQQSTFCATWNFLTAWGVRP
jgi:ubiquinone/menaquinone biosynthesis C-methylase UbiE